LSSPWLDADWILRSQQMLNSYACLLGKELIERTGNDQEDSERLFHAPFVVVAHGTESDPILNFGNQTALKLWDISLDAFLRMPSRLTAEPVHRDERARLLERTTRDGFVDDYRGIRISSSGKRFLISQAVVWNISDENGIRIGQAATFADWEWLPVLSSE
jgi:hypothetical protein